MNLGWCGHKHSVYGIELGRKIMRSHPKIQKTQVKIIQHSFMLKNTLNKKRINGYFLDINMIHTHTHTQHLHHKATILLAGEMKGCQLSPLLRVLLEILATAMDKRKKV